MNLSIKRKFFLLLTLAGLTTLIILSVTLPSLYSISDRFDRYLASAASRQSKLMNIKSNMGFGEGIHSFKNYVLRGQEKYYPRLNEGFSEALKNIQEYRQLPGINDTETQALDDIQLVVQAYLDNSRRIRPMVEQGASADMIDQVVKINDAPAIEGFNALEKRYHELTQLEVSTLESEIDQSVVVILAVILVLTLVVLTVGYVIVHSIGRRIHDASLAMQEIAEGDGDLTRDLSTEGGDEISDLGASFNTFSHKITEIIRQVVSTSHQLENSTSVVKDLNLATQQDVILQQSQTESTAHIVDEMATSIRTVSDHANSAAQTAEQANAEAEAGKLHVSNAIDTISNLASEMRNAAEAAGKLEQDSQQIGTVLEVIREIADQTNLLALNAAIEAARAGEQGRGFAVVADEVRTLASRTQQSTQQIQKIIEELQGNTKHVVKVIDDSQNLSTESVDKSSLAATSLQTITESVKSIKQVSTMIVEAVMQQQEASQNVSNSIEMINEIGNRSASSARESVEQSNSMNVSAAQLKALVDQFKI